MERDWGVPSDLRACRTLTSYGDVAKPSRPPPWRPSSNKHHRGPQYRLRRSLLAYNRSDRRTSMDPVADDFHGLS